ncbi:hypothetical protein [Pedobacter caeni]|uniref:Uncharacterized protein n=1 Tax=Pedobacter caeni TaxID=288992 RepID=A0A1M4UHW3_9SPHI|nr:hypothetical protein [Pedobacter caeni]SHE56372.1 hypothetical protein SAMN04488522_101570 [Pedobacter caeni]
MHQSFESIESSLEELFNKIEKASNNGYQNLLNSNRWGTQFHKLTTEELFFMNVSNKEILAILNLSIHNSIVKNDYSILIDGVFMYSRFRFLNWTHAPGTNDWIAIESLITNDKELMSLVYPETLVLTDDNYDFSYLLSRNLLRTILANQNWKEHTLQEYSDFINAVSGKFDVSFLNYLYGVLNGDDELSKTSFQQMEQWYSKCQWLTKGWYREADMVKKHPVFLLGLLQLQKLKGNGSTIEANKDWLKDAGTFLRKNEYYKPKPAFEFDHKLSFINEALTRDFSSFYLQYKNKIETLLY